MKRITIYILLIFIFACEKEDFSLADVNREKNFPVELENAVVLTLDDFPDGYSEEIVTFCLDNNIAISLFTIGDRIDNIPENLLDKFKRNNLITMENHSLTHANLGNADKYTINKEVLEYANVLGKFCRNNEIWNVGYFRPPYGSIQEWQINFIDEFRGGNTLLWDIDVTNWDNVDDTEYVKNKLFTYDSYEVPIIALHPNKANLDNLWVLKYLKEEEGVTFINLLEYSRKRILN